MVSIQGQFLFKSGLWWRVYGISNFVGDFTTDVTIICKELLKNTFYVMFLAFYAPKMLKMGLGPLSSLDCAMIPNTIVSQIIEFLIISVKIS